MGVLRGLRDFFTLGYFLIFGLLAQYWSMPVAFIFVASILIIPGHPLLQIFSCYFQQNVVNYN